MKQIELGYGEQFEIKNNKTITTWKMIMHGGGYPVIVHEVSKDWERIENKIKQLVLEENEKNKRQL